VLWQRALTAVVGIPLLLVIICLGSWYLGAVVLLLSLLGLTEFFRLSTACGLRPNRWVGHLAGTLIIALTVIESVEFPDQGFLAEWALSDRLVLVFVLAVLALFVHQVLVVAEPVTVANVGATMLGVIYIPFLFSYLIRIRSLSLEPMWLPGAGWTVSSGACWLALVIAACWAEDTAAYMVGKALGRHKLCPKISPGKTIEGAVAALAVALAVALALGNWFGLSLRLGAILGITVGVAGQLGDLSKSILKRQAEVKDSGAVIPGHGGVLDRFDSLLFSAPLTFYLLRPFAT